MLEYNKDIKIYILMDLSDTINLKHFNYAMYLEKLF